MISLFKKSFACILSCVMLTAVACGNKESGLFNWE